MTLINSPWTSTPPRSPPTSEPVPAPPKLLAIKTTRHTTSRYRTRRAASLQLSRMTRATQVSNWFGYASPPSSPGGAEMAAAWSPLVWPRISRGSARPLARLGLDDVLRITSVRRSGTPRHELSTIVSTTRDQTYPRRFRDRGEPPATVIVETCSGTDASSTRITDAQTEDARVCRRLTRTPAVFPLAPLRD